MVQLIKRNKWRRTMASNQRIDEFLRLQDKGISLDEIASTLGVKPQTLRRNLNKNGYKSVNGKYIKDNKESINTSVQVSFVDNTLIKNEQNKKENKPKSAKKSSIEKKLKSKEDKVEKSPEKINNKKNKATLQKQDELFDNLFGYWSEGLDESIINEKERRRVRRNIVPADFVPK